MFEDQIMSPPLLGDLNDPQRDSVTHGDGPLLILAGAGSGKTRVLTRRIAYLVHEKNLAPERILALTFTNKAAGEMAGRVEQLLGMPVRGLWIGTFHSICLRLLRRHGTLLGYGPSLSVFDADDQRGLVRRLLKEEGLEEGPRRARDLLGIISRAKTAGLGAEAFREQARTPAQRVAATVYERYESALRAQNAADFDDLLLQALRLMREHPDVADRYAERFRHVLVDEYQDTNRVQFLLVERLARTHRNIFVVGDDDQSIYGWRGADVKNIIDFREHFPDAAVYRLEQNYRSTGAILSFANAVIRHNESRWEKELWTEREEGPKPQLVVTSDEDEEAEEIARRIAALTSTAECPHGSIAVFYRTHAQSRPLEDAFLRSHIPYVLVGGVYFYQRREVKDLLSYLRVLANPRDEVSLRRALSVPRRGVGETSIDRLLETAHSRGCDPLDLATEGGGDSVRGKARKALGEFGALMLALRERLAEPPERILGEIIERISFKRYLESQGGEWEERAANVDELVESARSFSSSREGGVPEYLDQVSLLTSVDDLDREADRVTLMTVHNAKGLEFPHVFVCGLEEGLFPHVSAFEDDAELEEERRLFYVASTRARDTLNLSASLLRRRFNTAAGGVSRFMSEVAADLYEESEVTAPWSSGSRLGGRGRFDDRGSRPGGGPGRGPGGGQGGHSTGAASWPSSDLLRRSGSGREGGVSSKGWSSSKGGSFSKGGSPSKGWSSSKDGSPSKGESVDTFGGATDSLDHPLVGRRVFHATFGPGLVVAAEGKGDRARVTVRFNSGQTRKVISGYLEWDA